MFVLTSSCDFSNAGYAEHSTAAGLSPTNGISSWGHIAFAVSSVPDALAAVIANGGAAVGEVVTLPVAGVGRVTFVYARDPEGNIIELQSWEQAAS